MSLLGIVMDKSLGDVGQALLRPITIMFMTAATALMCITTKSVLWSFFDSEDDFRYDHINTRPSLTRSAALTSGPVQAIAKLAQWRGFRHDKDKTERSLQERMRPPTPPPYSGSYYPSGAKT
ncbi:hypothetical protein V8E52_007740 [Russula decolorans]|jgi:hypothetical protein